MFWKNIYMPSRIDSLLEKENVTLQELMDEDDVVQECKSSNKKLVDFLIKPEVLETLVNLMISEPQHDVEEKARYKYPNIACDLLTSDVTAITDALAENNSLLQSIYAFLECEGQLNPLQASFFSKTMGLLITHKSEMMVNFIKSRENFVDHLLRHLGTSAIMDLLLRLITCIESTECRNSCLQWLDEQNLVALLVARIDCTYSAELHCNACQSLCDIIRLSRDQSSHMLDGAPASDVLLLSIEKPETVIELLDHMFSGSPTESVIVNGIFVLQTLLETRRVNSDEQPVIPGQQNPSNSVIQAIIPRLKDFHQLLLSPPLQRYTPMPTSVGSIDQPLGLTRLQVVRLVSILVGVNDESINIQLSELGTIDVLLNLFFRYPWNNFLHAEVERCLNAILNCTLSENVLLSQLFKDFHVIERISESFDNFQNQPSPSSSIRPGNLGHLTLVANQLVSKLASSNEILQDLSEEVREQWDRCVGTILADINKQNSIELGGGSGGNNRMLSSSEDDDDFHCLSLPQDDALQKAFSDYQMQQMTSNFVEQFGFNEEDFAEPEEAIGSPFTDRISSINFDLNAIEDNIFRAAKHKGCNWGTQMIDRCSLELCSTALSVGSSGIRIRFDLKTVDTCGPTTAAMFEQACNDRIHQFDTTDSDEELWEKELTFSNIPDNRRSSAIPRDDNTRPESNYEEDFGEEEEVQEGSEGSSEDSDEDLDSPRFIRQTVKPSDNDPDKIPLTSSNAVQLVNGHPENISTGSNCREDSMEQGINGTTDENVNSVENIQQSIEMDSSVDPSSELSTVAEIGNDEEGSAVDVCDIICTIDESLGSNHVDQSAMNDNISDISLSTASKLADIRTSPFDEHQVPSVEQ